MSKWAQIWDWDEIKWANEVKVWATELKYKTEMKSNYEQMGFNYEQIKSSIRLKLNQMREWSQIINEEMYN